MTFEIEETLEEAVNPVAWERHIVRATAPRKPPLRVRIAVTVKKLVIRARRSRQLRTAS